MIRPPRQRFSFFHVMLVHGMVVLMLLTPCTQAGDILRMGGGGSAASGGTATPTGDAAAANAAAATAQAHANAQDMLARNTMALQAVDAMQQAAHAAAAGATNAGANPNFAGQTLPNVPDGLAPGGLDINGAPTGANAPTQSLQNAHTIVTIQQTQQQAMLYWNTFNVGSNTTVNFDQSAGGADVGNWIAFNKITDPSGNPTQILGSIHAQGQVYLINQNGIIFGSGSEVNTHAMVASALPLNDNLVTRGLLNNPDSQFLFTAIAQPVGANGTPAYTPPSVPAFGKIGNVTVQTGAQITAPTSSANVGGRVMLVGPNVTNNGTISTPDGQTVLAAGMQVGFDAHSSGDPSLRGLDVYVGSVGTYGGTATNAGLIEAPRGSVVIAGSAVNQNGFINSTTSAALNGRVDLLANYNAISNTNYNASNTAFGAPFVYQSNSSGIVRTGANSVIQILPEYASALTVVGMELALKSQVNLQGLGVYLGVNSVVFAPNAYVALSAGVWDLLLRNGVTKQAFVESSGQVYLDQGAVVNVAGSTAIAASITDYILTVDLRAAELADSALQRNGTLRGQSVTVDLREHGVRADGTAWVGTPLANLESYLGVIQRNVGQLTVAGGTVTIKAGESVVMQAGALVDVSGGYQTYDAASVQTTRLLYNGTLVDIANAQADVPYQGVYTPITSTTDPRWGTTTGTTSQFASGAHIEDAHSVGGNGGALAIYAPAMALDGSLMGSTITGPQQLEAAPQLSSLSLNFVAQEDLRAPGSPFKLFSYSPTPPAVTFSAGVSALPAAAAFGLNGSGAPQALRQERKDAVVLSSGLLSPDGFGTLLVNNSDGDITVPLGVTLNAAPTGSISLLGANVTVLGSLLAAGGSINLTAYDYSPYGALILKDSQGDAAATPPVNASRGKVTLGAAGALSTAGLIINDRGDATGRLTLAHQVSRTDGSGVVSYQNTTQGGSISINTFSANLAAGSLIDVSGGMAVNDTGVTYDKGGAISIVTGQDPTVPSLLGGQLTLGSTLLGFSGSTGGSLTLQGTTIQVGGSTALYPSTLLLQPEFFSTGGFASFTLKGVGSILGAQTFAPAVLIAPGTNLSPVVGSLQANISLQSGQSQVTVRTLVKPEGYRSTATLDLEASGVTAFGNGTLVVRGDIVMGAGAQIVTDALGSVTLHGQTVEVLGSIVAPGGSISVAGGNKFADTSTAPTTAFATVHLGAASVLSTAGKTVLLQDPYGLRTGTVYAGGTLSVSGNIVADTGAVLNVSGTSAVLDLLATQTGSGSVFTAGLNMAALFPGTSVTQPVQQAQTTPTRVDSNGGSLMLKGSEFLYSRATLLGQAGGSTAQGGSLTVKSSRFYSANSNIDDKDLTLLVAQDMATMAVPVFTGGQVIGKSLTATGGAAIKGQGYFGINSFLSGGFDTLTLSGNVQFTGVVNVTANAALHVADGGVLAADALTQLTAPYVALGRPLTSPTRDEELSNPYFVVEPGVGSPTSFFSPTYGSGKLVVTADLIETGFLSLQNIGQSSLTATQDLRGNSYFDMAGDLTITAGQIYPVTASTFTITAYNYSVGGVAKNGSVTIASSGATPEFPLSGGGRLNIYASTITQGGTLRAPFGTITLGWDGTGTAPIGLVTNVSVPVTQQITLKSGGLTSVSAIDPQTGLGVSIPYGIVKDGTNWIDPTGFDITGVGVPDKTIKVAAANVTTEAGSNLDIRGGGELYGYRWVEGNGGTNDILDTTGSYAILPGYTSFFAPNAPYATSGVNVANLGGDKGYTNSTLAVGERIFLKAAPGLAEGVYTLLPARYALLPGALLVTPDTSGTLTSSQVKPGGALLTSGYVFNSLNSHVTGTIYQQYEVAPQDVVRLRASYTDYTTTAFIPTAQQKLSLTVTPTTSDAGYALLSAQQTMQLNGGVEAEGAVTGRGGRVDVSSPLDIVLAAPGAAAQPGKLLLNTTLLSSWNAESLLIGGVRNGTSVTARTNNLTLNNAGAPLTGKEIILVANQTVNLAANAVLTQSGVQSTADALVVSGNGALVRVSGVAGAQTSRTGVTSSATPALNVAAGVSISGPSITLDSTNATSLDNSTSLTGQSINLNSGRVSLLLNNPGSLQSGSGLVLGGTALSSLQNTTALSLLSYSSLDLYGTGTFSNTGTLALHAGEIRGFNQGAAGTVSLVAQAILMDNSANGTVVGVVPGTYGKLSLTASTITIGQNALVVDQFTKVTLNAANGIVMQGTGSFTAQADLNAVTPFFSATSSATQVFAAGGVLTLTQPTGPLATPGSLGLGGQVSFSGATVSANSDILLPSGVISMTATNGNLTVGGNLNAGGTAQTFFDTVRYTNAGQVFLNATVGNVILSSTSVVNVAAAAAGDAGTLTINAGSGVLTLNNSQLNLQGQAGTGGKSGSLTLDVGSLSSFAALNSALAAGGFTNSLDLRVRTGSVTIDGTVKAHQFTLGVDQGGITVNGMIDGSGAVGGSIILTANGNLTLAALSGTAASLAGSSRIITVNSSTGVTVGQTVSGTNIAAGTYVTAINGSQITLSKDVTAALGSGTAVSFGAHLTVAAVSFDDAGKGGSIWLESGSQYQGTVGSGFVDIQTGTTLDLSVAAKVAGNGTTVGTSAFYGQYSGTVHIRAPQTTTPNFIQVRTINGTFIDPSNIVIEGYKLYDKNQANVVIQAGTQVVSGATYTTATFATDAASFFGASNVNYNSMFSRLVSANTSIMTLENSLTGGVVVIAPGIEISNRGGNVTLGSTTSSAYLNDWDLSLASFHLGPKSAPGYLTIRAAGNLVLYNTISDGFQVPTTGNGAERMWLAPLTAQSNLRPVNAQSWGFHLVAGADQSAANYSAVKSLSALASTSGSVMIGKNAVDALGGNTSGDPNDYLTRLAINPTGGAGTNLSNFFQVVRTGSGDINVVAGRDVQLLNQFATIYSAGVQVASSTTVFTTGDFVLPNVALAAGSSPNQGALGAVQQLYPAQYSRAGGNVSVMAGNDIIHYTRDPSGTLLLDSERELPNNWVMRRDYVNSSGNYGTLTVSPATDSAASATWWVNFSNFFDGVATLGGGNVTLKAGRDVQNVSAHAATNARAAKGAATAANLLELGGGDVTVTAGRNIDGGIYYVERGLGTLQASGAITTNSTRAPSTGRLSGGTLADDEALTNSIYQNTWLPTTLFAGKSTFNVSARGDVLLGPVANTMLMPQGITNRHWYKTYFSTYSDTSAVNVTSLSGNVTFRTQATLPQNSTPDNLLYLWMNKELLYADDGSTSASFQPWLRLVETDVTLFSTLMTVMPGTLKAVAYSGDINLAGSINLAPSPTGTLELLAAGAINGLVPTGVSSAIILNKNTNVWASATINLSDANPQALPSYQAPLSYYAVVISDPANAGPTATNNALRVTNETFLSTVNALFGETGSTTGEHASTQSKQTLHAKGLLHANDTKPALLYARGGSLSGLTFFSAKAANIVAQQDITDIDFYIQNVRSSDVSIVSAGRDIVAYNASSALRSQAVSTGNFTALLEVPKSGDIQISGPGSLQVLTGRDLNLGTGGNNPDGTGVGITSIGNGRNPYLPFVGADITLAAGMGRAAVGLAGSGADFTTFITQFATSPAGSRYLSELATVLGVAAVDLNDPSLTPAQQKELALAIYYLVLRDAGRDHNDPDSPNAGTYTAGYDAIAALFPTSSPGSIETQARDVRTKSGGNISILAPDGGLQLASSLLGDTLAPPGIITEAGGGISIFANDSINIGISRIFTLRGGDIMIWSSTGDIAAGSSSKTVQSAPPTRVLIDPQSANVATDLAGLATGGGIGVLATVAGVAPANVDLIAPIGAVDAGDAGIRATGNLNIAATVVLNSANISVGGTSAGTPAAVSVAAPSLGGAAAAASAGAATTGSNTPGPAQNQPTQVAAQDQPSLITVEVLGYGGGSGDERKRGSDQPGE